MRQFSAAIWGALVGVLGGLIGLGGAEFRLPVLISVFRFGALEAVILNKAMSLVVVAFALPFRSTSVAFESVIQQWSVIVNLLAGSLIGAWVGASWATRLRSTTLYRVIAVLLVAMAVMLLIGHAHLGEHGPAFSDLPLVVAGIVCGFLIGVVASLLGVAGGELLIPTLVLLFGLDLKLAGSVSLAVSLPTMLAGFVRYSRDQSFAVIRRNGGFALAMGAGSIAGAFLGGRLLGVASSAILLPLLAAILLFSAFKVWRHR